MNDGYARKRLARLAIAEYVKVFPRHFVSKWGRVIFVASRKRWGASAVKRK